MHAILDTTTPLWAAQVDAIRAVDRSIINAEAHLILRIATPHIERNRPLAAIRPVTREIVAGFDRMSPQDQVAMMAHVRPLVTAAADVYRAQQAATR